MKKLTLSVVILAFIAAGCTGGQGTTDVSGQKQEQTNSGSKTYTMAEVATANSAENCLSVINSKVYNLTEWIKKHPGGQKAILGICGKDGTEAFMK